MLKNFLISLIRENLEFEPTVGQTETIDKFSEFILDTSGEKIMLIRGYAGTGKTTLVKSFLKALEKIQLNSLLLAPTGRAAKVLANYSGKSAFTIHKEIYRQKMAADAYGEFNLNTNLRSKTIFIVDEASMISNSQGDSSVFGSGRLLTDLLRYVYNGKLCKLVLIGDTAQLPPVGSSLSPALSAQALSYFGFDVVEVEMTEVVRQAAESGILFNATEIRKNITNFRQPFVFPKFTLSDFPDIFRITGTELIEYLNDMYGKFSLDETLVITRSNKVANRFNTGIRNTILYREEEISTGDYLMVVKNNYFWTKEMQQSINFIANGDILEIIRIKKYEEKYGHRFANVIVRMQDYNDIEIECKIMLDTLMYEGPALSESANQKFFDTVMADYQDIESNKERMKKLKENEYFNALQVKFAYAITCHKSQGGQWKAVFIIQEYLSPEMLTIDYLRWLYTAFTRSTEKLYLVNFKEEHF